MRAHIERGADTEETRVVDPLTGGAKGAKLARFELIPVGPLLELARLYGAGAKKYEDRNWERGYAWSLSYAALQRHANLFWGGESIDSDTQRHHLASVIFHAMALMEFEAKGKGTDDRPTARPPYEGFDGAVCRAGGCFDCSFDGCKHHEARPPRPVRA